MPICLIFAYFATIFAYFETLPSHFAYFATANGSRFLSDDSYFLRIGGLNPHQEAVVLVVVGDDKAMFMLHVLSE